MSVVVDSAGRRFMVSAGACARTSLDGVRTWAGEARRPANLRGRVPPLTPRSGPESMASEPGVIDSRRLSSMFFYSN